MDRDPFDFDDDETEVERPGAGEEDPALLGPVFEALKTVRDPEIPMDLVELGLIYELIVKRGGTVYVEMTLTTPACPVAASCADHNLRQREEITAVAAQLRPQDIFRTRCVLWSYWGGGLNHA
jgi:metal-sulfur cluster biosynthetic enzyme